MSKSKSGKKIGIAVSVILAAILAVTVTLGALVYFDKLDVDFINDAFISAGWKDGTDTPSTDPEGSNTTDAPTTDTDTGTDQTTDTAANGTYEVIPPDAEEYFEQNATLEEKISAEKSLTIHTEAEAYENLQTRGFAVFPITSEYSINGAYGPAKEISYYGSQKHPVYHTYYRTASDQIWAVMEINGEVFALPLSYNSQTEDGVPAILSETGKVTSYDSTTNTFFVTVPNPSVFKVITVERIDEQILETTGWEDLQ